MKIAIVLFLSVAASAFAQVKPCDELKSEIAAKIDANGVKNYQLDIVAAADVKDQTVVGSCEGGTKKIVYAREGAATTNKAPTAKASEAKPSPTGTK